MTPAAPAGKTVLIVDDDPAVRGVLHTTLAQEGYRVAEAGDGREALDLLRRGGVDVVLLDMMLPVLDGWAFLAAKRADPALNRVPAVIITGLGVAGRDWALAQGAAGFLRKPVDTEQLLDEVRRLC